MHSPATVASTEAAASSESPATVPFVSTEPKRSLGRRVLSWLLWFLVRAVWISIFAAGWHYRGDWLPKLEQFLVPPSTVPAKSGARVVPVVTAPVKQRDVPLYLNGLGTVTAFKTVTVKSRVPGELLKVAISEGQMVQEGDLLAEVDGRSFDVQKAQAEGQLKRDLATLRTAQQTLERFQQLLESKSVTAQQIEEQQTIVQQAEGAIQTDRALIANAQLQLGYCRITAPISGRIGLIHVDEGNMVNANDEEGIAVITQLQPIALLFTIPQDDIARVLKRMNEGAKLQVDAFNRDFKTQLATGELLAIDNQVDPTTGTVRLKAVFENKDGLLFPNQFVNARLHVESRSGAIVVPTSAVQRGPASNFVYVALADETVELRNVVIGPAEGGETVIESGLTPSDLVVTDGIDKLQPGAKVSFRKKDAAKQ